MLPEKFYLLHMTSNIISGIAFWGVSYCFSVFIDRMQLKLKQDDEERMWLQISKYSSIFSVISAVFFFCGLGHLVEAFVPWTKDFRFIMIVHSSTAGLAGMLIYLLYKNLFLSNEK